METPAPSECLTQPVGGDDWDGLGPEEIEVRPAGAWGSVDEKARQAMKNPTAATTRAKPTPRNRRGVFRSSEGRPGLRSLTAAQEGSTSSRSSCSKSRFKSDILLLQESLEAATSLAQVDSYGGCARTKDVCRLGGRVAGIVMQDECRTLSRRELR